jgi:alpha-1,6-mannosyltransferase
MPAFFFVPVRQAAMTTHLLDATMFWNASGGVQRYLRAKHGWIASNTAWRHTVASPMQDEVSTLQLPALPLPGSNGDYRLPWHRKKLGDLLRGARPSLIESADPYRLAWAALDAARSLGIPCAAFCHSNLPRMAGLAAGQTFGRAAAAATRCYAVRLYSRFDLVLAPSRAMVEQLAEWGVARTAHQPLGVDSDVFHPCRRDPGWRRTLGLPDDARLLVYVGRFAPEKNLPALIEAVRLLGRRYWLLAVGSGTHPPRGERVIVGPPVRDPRAVATLLASSDLFVHAGRHETFGLSVLEALACGLPVVAPAVQGLGELVDDRWGRTVVGEGAADHARAIAEAFESDHPTMSRAARERALRNDWSEVLPQLHARYCGLLGCTP